MSEAALSSVLGALLHWDPFQNPTSSLGLSLFEEESNHLLPTPASAGTYLQVGGQVQIPELWWLINTVLVEPTMLFLSTYHKLRTQSHNASHLPPPLSLSRLVCSLPYFCALPDRSSGWKWGIFETIYIYSKFYTRLVRKSLVRDRIVHAPSASRRKLAIFSFGRRFGWESKL